jgi:hypothetical protein
MGLVCPSFTDALPQNALLKNSTLNGVRNGESKNIKIKVKMIFVIKFNII